MPMTDWKTIRTGTVTVAEENGVLVVKGDCGLSITPAEILPFVKDRSFELFEVEVSVRRHEPDPEIAGLLLGMLGDDEDEEGNALQTTSLIAELDALVEKAGRDAVEKAR